MLNKLMNTTLFRVLRRETRRIADSWVLVFTTMIAPVAAFLVIMWLFSDGVVRGLPVAVVDMDNTAFSSRVTRLVDATPVCKVMWRLSSIDEAKQMMDAGKIDAIVVLPTDLERKVLNNSAPAIAVYINNTNVVKGGALKSGLYTTLSTISAGVKVQVAIKKGQTPAQAIEKARPVKVNVHLLFNPFGNYSYFLVLGLLPLLAVVFIFLGSVYALGMELKEGTAGELIGLAENNVTVALAGKMLPYTFLFFMDLMIMNIFLMKTLGTPVHGSLFLILVSEILLIISYQLLAILFLKLTANLRLSLSLGSAYTMMALTFSGLTFPSMAMPLIAKLFSLIFPYTYWLQIFMSQTLRGEPASEVVLPFLAFIPFILGGILAFPGMKRKLTHQKYWFRE
ncbi:MAG TPA: ABC transporter permease [Prolixibacteraceae bacterium]|jgi:ABC-2 type transport system permease protein